MRPFTMEHLPYAGGVMTHICVSLIKLPLQIMMGHVPTLEYMLLGVHGLRRPCLIVVR
jgi:hypothetical protein